MKFFTFSLFILLCSLSNQAYSKGPSPYLPLQVDPLIELELNRLASLAKLPILTKPYHAATINRYLKKISSSHPILFKRISNYLKRYKKDAALTHASIQLNYASKKNIPVVNQRGQMTDANYQASFSGFLQANQYVIINTGGTYNEGGGYTSTNSFISVGDDYFQVDLGYKEHWLSPFQEGAVLLSTQAKAPLSISLSNPKLITDYKVKYELSVAKLEKHTGIRFDREKAPVSGKPALLMMHLSAQPFDWWTIGFNRTLMFGGDKKVTLQDVWHGIIDPVNSDNCGGHGTDLQDCAEELGNQQASITNRFDVTWFDMPISISYEYAGEDTNNYTNYKLANLANSLGVFFPYLTETTALNIELTDFQSAWYTHHIYGEGYSNDGVKMGHWWGTRKDPRDSVGGEAASIRFDWQNSLDSQLSFIYRSANFNNSSYADYQASHELEINYTKAIKSAFLGARLYFGINNYGDEFVQTSVSYTW